jgi:ABC-2 type transport system ATP-binding protein
VPVTGAAISALRRAGQGVGVQISDLWVRRGQRDVLQGLDLEAPAGTVTGLLGPNGAGKSTTIGAFLGYLPHTRGTLSCGGRPLGETSGVRFGLAPQEASLYPALSVWDTLKVYAAYAAAASTFRWARMTESV